MSGLLSLTVTAVEIGFPFLWESCQEVIDETSLKPVFVVQVRPIFILIVQVEAYHVISNKNIDSTNMYVCTKFFISCG